MTRPLPARLLAASALVLTGAALLLSHLAARDASRDVLAADARLQWYRGNLHTHSLWSDGDDYPEMIALWYKEHGYQFLAFTEHNVLATSERWRPVLKNRNGEEALAKLKARFPENWIEERTVNGQLEIRLKTIAEVSGRVGVPNEYLIIQGEEITDKFQNFPVHMNATNVKELIPPLGGDSVYDVIQNNTNAVIAQRERTRQPMLVHLNHPNFHFGVTAEDLMRVRGENFFEVYNGHPGVNNPGDAQHASTERIWDIILTHRLDRLKLPIMYGLATDDGHNYHKIPSRASEPGRGWVMVLAEALTPAALIDALERGRFYASSGVTLEQVATSTKGLEVEVRPEPDVTYTIEFVGTRKGYSPDSQPVTDAAGKEVRATRRYSEDIGRVLQTSTGTRAVYAFTGDELYVRARVRSSKQHPNPSTVGEFEHAWTQPLRGPAAPPEE